MLSSARKPYPSSKTTSTLVPREKEPAPSRTPAPAPTVAPFHENGPARGMLSAHQGRFTRCCTPHPRFRTPRERLRRVWALAETQSSTAVSSACEQRAQPCRTSRPCSSSMPAHHSRYRLGMFGTWWGHTHGQRPRHQPRYALRVSEEARPEGRSAGAPRALPSSCARGKSLPSSRL